MQSYLNMWVLFLNQSISKLQWKSPDQLKLHTLWLQTGTPWRKRQRGELWLFLWLLISAFFVPLHHTLTATSQFPPQLVTAAPKVAGHVTLSCDFLMTYHKMESESKPGFTKCHLAFAEKCHRMLGIAIIIGVLKVSNDELLITVRDTMDSFLNGLMACTQHITSHALPW